MLRQLRALERKFMLTAQNQIVALLAFSLNIADAISFVILFFDFVHFNTKFIVHNSQTYCILH